MAHANGVDQKWHQDGIRIELMSQQRQQAQQPDHPDQRAALHHQRTAHATGETVENHAGDQHRHGEESQHRIQAVDQVAHDFGEADDVDIDATLRILFAQRFQAVGQFFVVQRLSGFGVDFEQGQIDDARAQVTRDQLADFA
ncbi:hypothetical protein D3C71_1398950 [compost metagenome]